MNKVRVRSSWNVKKLSTLTLLVLMMFGFAVNVAHASNEASSSSFICIILPGASGLIEQQWDPDPKVVTTPSGTVILICTVEDVSEDLFPGFQHKVGNYKISPTTHDLCV
jgi:hypothetical protein